MPRILLVDDEPFVLSSLRRAIAGMQMHLLGSEVIVETFDVPVLALQRASEVAFDLVISDFRMPEMDGLHFLKRIVALQPGIARIMLSGYADMNALISIINEVQVFRFVSKPWNNDELAIAMAQALDQRRLLEENLRLADLVRVQEGRLSRQEAALNRWESACPGLTKIERAEDGSVYLDWDDDYCPQALTA